MTETEQKLKQAAKLAGRGKISRREFTQLALASGLTTFKMHNGHRGINHPVINLLTGKGEITSQNHGFCVSDESMANNPEVEVTHRHLNDNTIAGIQLKGKPVFSVQYHPEASPGPHDSRYLFDNFVANLKKHSA